MAFPFLAIAIASAAYLINGQTTVATRIWRVAGVIAILLATYAFLPTRYITMGGEDGAWYEASPVKQGLGLVMIILGMAAKYLFDAIENRRTRIRAGEHGAQIAFDRWDFLQPFVVSSLVFGSFWKGYGNEVLSVEYLTVGFQTGFFWQTILQPRLAEGTKKATPAQRGRQTAASVPRRLKPD
jgi:hypothetical protein